MNSQLLLELYRSFPNKVCAVVKIVLLHLHSTPFFRIVSCFQIQPHSLLLRTQLLINRRKKRESLYISEFRGVYEKFSREYYFAYKTALYGGKGTRFSHSIFQINGKSTHN